MTKRRDFIKTSVVGAAGITIGGLGMSSKSYASIQGANDRITLAVAGHRSRGRDHINSWCALKDNRNVRIKTICDVDEQFFAPTAKLILDKSGEKVNTEWDMRKVFDD
ncbi:MAG: twin-arginine translocation signal domain-containing protein, partial [Bacteroidales bacterium]